MGIFKKVFGGGSIRMPEVVETPPATTTVTSTETGTETDPAKKNKRRGFASTQVSSDRNTIAGNATGRKTLG